MFQPRSATARHAIDSIDKVNNKVDDVSVDNFIGTSGVYTSSSSKSPFLSKFSDDFGSEIWIEPSGRQDEKTSSFDLSPQKSQIPRNQDENQISEKGGTEPEVSKTSFTRSVHQRKLLRRQKEGGGGGETDQGWENSFRPRQKQDLSSEKWTHSDNAEEDPLLSSSYVGSHDFLASRLVRPERSVDTNDAVSDDPGQANPAAIPYNHLPLHSARNDQSDEKCSGRDCVNSLNSEDRERSAKPFRSANSDHRGSSWTPDAITENGDAGDSRDKEDDNLLVTPNPTAQRKRLKVIQSALKLQNSIKTFQFDKDLFTVF